MFGPVSFRVQSHLKKGEVLVGLEAPPRRPERWLVRLPLPAGWEVTAAQVGDTPLVLGKNRAVDLTGRTGRFTVRFAVRRS